MRKHIDADITFTSKAIFASKAETAWTEQRGLVPFEVDQTVGYFQA